MSGFSCRKSRPRSSLRITPAVELCNSKPAAHCGGLATCAATNTASTAILLAYKVLRIWSYSGPFGTFFDWRIIVLDSSGYAPHLIEPASDMRCGAQSQSQDYEGVACKFGRRTKAPAYIFSGRRNAVVAAGSVLTIILLNGAERSQTPSSHVIERFSEAEWEFNL